LVIAYFRFYLETVDVQRNAFVGTLLMNKAKEWHLAWDEEFSQGYSQVTWVVYSEAIQDEYVDPREAATTYANLKFLKYKVNIKLYLIAFKTLNHRAGSNGEGLQDIINDALPNKIIDVRFYQNPADLITDEDFLVATYQAERYV
jgi:hypothetical protein